MADRYRSADGRWRVEVVRLTGTPDRHDGAWIRVRYFGWFVADVRAVEDLAAYFPLAALELDGLGRKKIKCSKCYHCYVCAHASADSPLRHAGHSEVRANGNCYRNDHPHE
jgi:hypothetical protein